jgi:hypothetical protein
MTRMPFLWVEAPERKPGPMKFVLQGVMTVAVLSFCALMVLRSH